MDSADSEETTNGDQIPSCNIQSDTNNGLFYDNAKKYWSGVPATVDGMLGGFSHISSTDISGSVKFLRHVTESCCVGQRRALDCGAGIGRVSKRLLLPTFNHVDILEQEQSFVDQSPGYLGPQFASRVERYICCGLQDFTPDAGRYDVIWCQWVLGHLTDEHLVDFLQRAVKGLAKNGIIAIKENTAAHDEAEFDVKDSSFTRPKSQFLKLFTEAGLVLKYQEKQKNFPKNIYDVYMFALQ